jgi:hypothetical protein
MAQDCEQSLSSKGCKWKDPSIGVCLAVKEAQEYCEANKADPACASGSDTWAPKVRVKHIYTETLKLLTSQSQLNFHITND